jgi:hypothetical protein
VDELHQDGPMNDPLLANLLVQARALNPIQCQLIGAAHRAARDPGNVAWNRARVIASIADGGLTWRMVSQAIGGLDLDERVTWAALDAALALLTTPTLDPADFARLYEPWSRGFPYWPAETRPQ